MTGPIKRSALYVLAVALAAVGLFYAVYEHRISAAAPFPDLLELAPADSTMIGYADLRALRESPLVQQLVAMAPAPQVDRDYADFVSATGFDYQRDLDRLLILGRPGAAPSGNALVFAEGRFNRQKMEQYALRSGKRVDENGRAVFIVPSTTPGKNVRLAFLAPDRIALSDGGDLPALSSSSPALDQPMRERLSRIAGAPVFAEINATQFASRIGSNAGSPVAMFASPFRSLRWVSLALRPDGEQLLLSVEGECANPEDAQKVAGTLELFRGILRGMLANPKARGQMPAESVAATGKFLDAMKITTDAEHARIVVSVTPEMLRLPSQPSPAAH